jgi:hypothetical protein
LFYFIYSLVLRLFTWVSLLNSLQNHISISNQYIDRAQNRHDKCWSRGLLYNFLTKDFALLEITANPALTQVQMNSLDIKKTSSLPQESPYSPQKNQQAYDRIYNQISARYAHFDQGKETGFQGGLGLTSDISDITKKDIVGAMMHIRDDDKLLEQCFRDSTASPLFDKIYLMKNPEQAWNLRIHHYNARGSGLGGEDSPHYHRWTLATASLTGGYVNVNYAESEVKEDSNQEHIYNKYLLGSTASQTSTKNREVVFLGKKIMEPVHSEIYSEGRMNHFPIEEPHSVKTFPNYFGSTLTFAHTGAPVNDTSYAFEKSDLEAIPQLRYTDVNEFRANLDKEITFLQVLDLKDDFKNFLAKKNESGVELTNHEMGHQHDSCESNYVETSLLSTLAIYDMEKINGVEHREFAPDTVKFLDGKLAHINMDALRDIIAFNQEDLLSRRFTVSVDSDSELGKLLGERGKPDHKSQG